MIKSMFYMQVEGVKILETFDIIKVCTVVGILFLCHWFMRNTSVKEVAQKISPVFLGIVWAIMIFILCIAQGSGEQFIYFQF